MEEHDAVYTYLGLRSCEARARMMRENGLAHSIARQAELVWMSLTPAERERAITLRMAVAS